MRLHTAILQTQPWPSRPLGETQMLYVVLFEDDATLGADVRHRHMAAHLSFLEHNTARIKAAGPLRALSGDPVGGLWIVEADSPDVTHFGRPVCGTPFAFSAGPRCSQMAGGYFDVLPARFFSGRVLRIEPDAHAAGCRNGRWPISHALHPGYSC